MKHLASILLTVIAIVGMLAVPAYAQGTGDYRVETGSGTVYVVRYGDTLAGIARRFGTTVKSIMSTNGLTSTRIYVGQRLTIPSPQPGPSIVYVVRRGDTLAGIARRFGTTVKSIMSTNRLTSTRIYVGQRLVIPGAQPSPIPNAAVGWAGRIVKFSHGSQFDDCFERDDGGRWGIEANDAATKQRIEAFRWTGARVQVWGRLIDNIPDVNGRQILVERIEAMSEPEYDARNLALFATASASSVLPSDRWGTYHAWSAIDGRLDSPWTEGVAGPGIGESVTLTFPGTIEVWGVGLDVGYDRDADLFRANNRIKRALLIFSSGEQVEVTFSDERGMQMIALARAPGPSIETTYIKIIIQEVYPGTRYDDTCLGEIQVLGKTK